MKKVELSLLQLIRLNKQGYEPLKKVPNPIEAAPLCNRPLMQQVRYSVMLQSSTTTFNIVVLGPLLHTS